MLLTKENISLPIVTLFSVIHLIKDIFVAGADYCFLAINYCLSLPCLNGATCRNSVSGYNCKCSVAFFGRQCQNRLSSLTMRSHHANFESPGFPGLYPNNMAFTWYIYATVGYKLSVRFGLFDVEAEPGCSWDSVDVFDGITWLDSPRRIGRYCNSSPPPSSGVSSSGNTMTVVMKTDAAGVFRGFSALYRSRRTTQQLPRDLAKRCKIFCIRGLFNNCAIS